MDDILAPTQQEFPIARYRLLAELRHQLRYFLHFSEHAARANSLEPQQHQLMLAIKGLPEATPPTVSSLARRLCLKHHSTVELINRLVDRGAAVRRPSLSDRRQVLVELTSTGEELLRGLAPLHNRELEEFGPALLTELERILRNHFSAHSSQPEHETKMHDAAPQLA